MGNGNFDESAGTLPFQRPTVKTQFHFHVRAVIKETGRVRRGTQVVACELRCATSEGERGERPFNLFTGYSMCAQ